MFEKAFDFIKGKSSEREVDPGVNGAEKGAQHTVSTGAFGKFEGGQDVVDVTSPQQPAEAVEEDSDVEEIPELVVIKQPLDINYAAIMMISDVLTKYRRNPHNGSRLLHELPRQVTMYKKKPLDILLAIEPQGLKGYWGFDMKEKDKADLPIFKVKGTG